MTKARSLVGLDVHASKIVAAVLDAETGELTFFQMTGDSVGAAGFCAALPAPVRATYEAGPTGYGLARDLARRGVDCVVAAPSKIPRGSGDRIKTDRRDAEHLARLLMAGRLHPVRVPGDEEEALRDLVRAREAVRTDLMRCRHRLSKLLLRHGIRFEDGNAWTDRHRQWLNHVALGFTAAQATLADAIGAVDALEHRRGQLEREILALLPSSPWSTEVGRLRCLRGVDTLTAVGLCAEIGDFARFAKAGQLMHYIGLTPSEDTSGDQRRLGHITKTGSGHARRLLVEAGWHYRKQPRVGRTLVERQAGQPPEAIAVAWSAQRRLHRVWARLEARNKRRRSSRSQPLVSSPGSAGRSPRSSESWTSQLPHPVGWVGGDPARAGNPRSNYEQPAVRLATLGLRQRLPTTNHGPAAPGAYPPIRAYQSDPRRAQQPGRHQASRLHNPQRQPSTGKL